MNGQPAGEHPGGDDVRAATAAVRALLERVPDGALHEPVMARPVVDVARHVASCLAWYAHDLVAGPDELWPAELVRRPDATVADFAGSIEAWGEVLARTVESSPPGERGWHDHGRPDAAGYAAMGCAETLVHGHDVAVAAGLDLAPPAGIAAAVLHRLFPDEDAAGDPWEALLRATGRRELPGGGRRGPWRYASAPAGERASS